MGIVSNNVKVSFIGFNFQDRQKTFRRRCLTVQDFRYEFSRNINAYGKAYGASSGGIVSLTLRTGTQYNFRDCYESLKTNEAKTVSLVYNAVFDDFGELFDYDGAMIISGYVVSLEEDYNRTNSDVEGEQMCLKMDILIARVSYIGVNSQLDMSFTQ